MQHGWRRQRSTFRSVILPLAARQAGTGPTPLLYFAVVKAAVMPMRTSVHLLVLLHSSSWSLHRGECPRAQSRPCRMSPFLDFSRSPSRFLSQSLSLDLPLSLPGRSVDRGFCSELHAQGASPTRCWCQQCWNGGLNNYQRERTPHPGPSSKTASCLPFWFLEVVHQVRRTQLYPEMMIPEVEKAADAQARAEGSESPTRSIGLLPWQ